MFHAITQVPQKQVLPSWKCKTIKLVQNSFGAPGKEYITIQNDMSMCVCACAYVHALMYAEMHYVFNIID